MQVPKMERGADCPSREAQQSVPGIPTGMDTSAADPNGLVHCLLTLTSF